MRVLLYLIFFLSVLAPIYTYTLYPLILKLFPKITYSIDLNYRPKVSVLIAAYNEERIIAEKIENLMILDYPKDKIEFLVGSDGSNDQTVSILKKYVTFKNLRIFDLPRGGKVNVLNYLLNHATGDVLVFSDANTMFKENAVLELVTNFKDKRIGCVSGQLRYKVDRISGQGAKSESTYWTYENWVKVQESRIGRLSGANGAIYAIRCGAIKQIPAGIINDDFYVATFIMQNGFDVIMNTDAIAYEVPNDALSSQFNRHVRDGAGHYQAMCVFWRMLFPRRGSFVYISHRVIKWIVPFCLILAFLTNVALAYQSVFMRNILMVHISGYVLVLVYHLLSLKFFVNDTLIAKVFKIVFYFLFVNSALFLGFFRYISKRQKCTWEINR
jgi:poly-beta-1,6-N-acetyl-D-glucosamine synthase